MLPLVSGVAIYLYPSPLHYRMIPELIYETNATILFGTDTFLAAVARSALSSTSARCATCSPAPAAPGRRATYMEKFGLRILEATA